MHKKNPRATDITRNNKKKDITSKNSHTRLHLHHSLTPIIQPPLPILSSQLPNPPHPPPKNTSPSSSMRKISSHFSSPHPPPLPSPLFSIQAAYMYASTPPPLVCVSTKTQNPRQPPTVYIFPHLAPALRLMDLEEGKDVDFPLFPTASFFYDNKMRSERGVSRPCRVGERRNWDGFSVGVFIRSRGGGEMKRTGGGGERKHRGGKLLTDGRTDGGGGGWLSNKWLCRKTKAYD